MILDVVKVLLPAVLGFLVGIGITPTITDYLYKNKMWKKKVKSVTVDGREATVFMSLHKDKEVNTPRMGGAIIWLSALITAFVVWFLAKIVHIETFSTLEFISRNQTWIPFCTLLLGAGVGLIDDLMEIKGSADQKAGGLSAKKRLFSLVWWLWPLDSGFTANLKSRPFLCLFWAILTSEYSLFRFSYS